MRRLKPWQTSLFAMVVTMVMIAFRISIDDVLGGRPTLIMLSMPIMLAAYIGGLPAGLLATATAYFGASYYLLPPLRSFEIASGVDHWQQFFLVLAGVFISVVNEALHRARRRADLATHEHQQAKEALRESEELFAKAFRMSPDCLVIVRVRARTVIRANDALCRLWGSTPEAIVGKQSLDYLSWFNEDERLDYLSKLQERGEYSNFEAVFRMADGRLLDMNISCRMITFEEESCVLCVMRDISEAKRSKKAMDASELRYRRLFETAKEGILILDAENGMVVDVNPFLISLLGVSHEQFLGKVIWDLGFFKEILANEASFAELTQKEYILYENLPLETIAGRRIEVEFISSVYLVDGEKIIQCNVRDLTPRKLGEIATAQLAAIVQSSDDAIIGKTLDGIVTSWNRGAERIFGYSSAEMVGQPITRLIPHERLQEEVEILARVRSGEGVRHFDTVRLRKDDSIIEVSITTSAIKDAAGKIVGASKIARDITERKLAEETLRETEQRMRLATETTGVGVWEWHVPTNSIRWDAQMFRIHGVTPTPDHTVEYSTWASLVLPEDLAAQEELLQEMVRRAGRGVREFRIQRADDLECRHIYAVETARTNRHGHAEWVVGTNLDVTDRKRAEEALRESEEQFRTMVNAMSQLAWMAEPDGFIYWYNQRWFEYTGTTPASMKGWGWQQVHDPEKLPEVLDKWQAAIASGRPFEMDFPLRDADGRFRWFLTRAFPFRDSMGRLVRWFGTNTDISEKRDAVEEIHRLNAELEQRVRERTAQLEVANAELEAISSAIERELRVAEAADKTKSTFLATMSHELRTPLNSIIGFTGILLQGLAGELNAEQRKQLGMVQGSARHLLELINDILDLSRIEAGQLDIRVEAFDLVSSIERVTASVRPLAERKGLSLNIAISASTKALLHHVMSDRRRVEQILLNLLTNAIKFTERGGVTLEATMTDDLLHASDQMASMAVNLCVTDTGIGITALDLATLFQPFRQIDDGLARNQEGSGLGLTICRRLAELLGGEIRVDSESNKGSSFCFTLPL